MPVFDDRACDAFSIEVKSRHGSASACHIWPLVEAVVVKRDAFQLRRCGYGEDMGLQRGQ